MYNFSKENILRTTHSPKKLYNNKKIYIVILFQRIKRKIIIYIKKKKKDHKMCSGLRNNLTHISQLKNCNFVDEIL